MLRRFTVSLVVVALAFCLLVSPVFADGLMVKLDRRFATKLLKLECGQMGKGNRADKIAEASKALLQQENLVERSTGEKAFG